MKTSFGSLTPIRKIILAVIMLTSATGKAHASEATIGSASLCADSYVLALAPERAAELSWQSRSALSRATPAQRALPQIWDSPEIIAASRSDMILFGSGEGALAQRLGKPFQQLTWGEDFASIKVNAEMIAKSLGRPDTISAELTSRLSALKARSDARGKTPKVLYLARSGGSAGSGTLVDAVISAAGGVNVLETGDWASPDPEILLGLKPDLIVTSYFENGYESVNALGARNKALRAYIKRFPSIHIDGALWPCAGPNLIEAAEILADAMDALP